MDTLNLDKLKATKSVYFPVDLLSVARTPNTEQLWIGASNFEIYSLDMSVAKPQPVAMGKHDSYVSGLVVAGKVLISAGWDRKLIWWDVEKRKPIRTVEAHRRWIRRIALSPDRTQLASISDDMTCKLWDIGSGKMTRELQGHDANLPRYDYPNKLYACAFSPDGKHIAVADELCRVIVWEVSGGKEAARFDAKAFFTPDWDRNNHPYGGLRALAFSPDGRSLALGGMHGERSGEALEAPVLIPAVAVRIVVAVVRLPLSCRARCRDRSPGRGEANHCSVVEGIAR